MSRKKRHYEWSKIAVSDNAIIVAAREQLRVEMDRWQSRGFRRAYDADETHFLLHAQKFPLKLCGAWLVAVDFLLPPYMKTEAFQAAANYVRYKRGGGS